MHMVLLGDSIFDNRRYVKPGEPDVTEQIESLLRDREDVTRLAVDGHVTTDIERQLVHVPRGATHLFVSVGGNDALGHLELFNQPARSIGEALLKLDEVRVGFDEKYMQMLDRCLAAGLPTTISTIYYPRFDCRELTRVSDWVGMGVNGNLLQRMAMAALPVFNDVILREAASRGLSVLDLRVLCEDDADFANPIEPSAIGGAKIARAIVAAARGEVSGMRSAALLAGVDRDARSSGSEEHGKREVADE